LPATFPVTKQLLRQALIALIGSQRSRGRKGVSYECRNADEKKTLPNDTSIPIKCINSRQMALSGRASHLQLLSFRINTFIHSEQHTTQLYNRIVHARFSHR
jgi:hypothetical protein